MEYTLGVRFEERWHAMRCPEGFFLMSDIYKQVLGAHIALPRLSYTFLERMTLLILNSRLVAVYLHNISLTGVSRQFILIPAAKNSSPNH